MARKRNKAKSRNKGGSQGRLRQQPHLHNQPSAKPETSEMGQLIQDANKQALTIAQEEGLDRQVDGDEPKPEGTNAESLWEMVREARDLFDKARKRFESRERALDDQAAKLDEQEKLITARSDEVDSRDRELAAVRTALERRDGEASERDKSLSARETDICKREINAECGFTKERQDMLSQLDKVRDERRQASEARWKEREGTLDEREDRLGAERRELAILKRQLAYQEADLEEFQADLDDRVEQRAAAIREELEHRNDSLAAQLALARRDRDLHAEKLRCREDADRKFGQRTPDEVLREMDVVRAERDRLQAELAERPDSGATARLAALEREREAWQAERADLSRKASEYRQRLARVNIDATERETQRDVITSLTSQRELLQEAHEKLQEEIQGLHRRSEARTPFPACTRMDNGRAFQTKQPLETGRLELNAFVEDLQHRIAATSSPNLYYSLSDLRSFIGGLAMGRLILLQGISGTGKTSLPVAFAKAIGTSPAEIKVQAGWRDPQDLIGHYNTFEKRFHETEFLKALYRAGTPQWRDTIQVILLDEMNLSHPEQYFSDILSTLELPEGDQHLELMTHAVDGAPAHLGKDGKLRIPPNVWFVGTANHDETTMDFADKTYDRSHVMEFPERPKEFKVERPPPRRPISRSALQEAFEASIRCQDDAKQAIAFLDSKVRDVLARDFHVGWGPRLDRQMQWYVPVVVAAGGTVGEATDHMLAMRLLRRLQNRHDNRPERIEALKQRVRKSWPDLDRKSEPTKSIALLDSELRRLGREPENGG